MAPPRSDRQRVAALVLTYRRHQLLRSALGSLAEQSVRPSRVLVVDNASADGTFELATDLLDEHSLGGEVVELARNGGSAEGYHLGLRYLLTQDDWDWVWFVEDDLVARPDALQRLLESDVMERQDTVAVASCIVDRRGAVLELPRGTLRSRLAGTPCRPIPKKRYVSGDIPIEYFGYLGSMVSRTALEAAGLPRRDYLGWIDDVEFSWRVSRAGRAYLVPASRVVHDDDAPIHGFQDSVLSRVKRAAREPRFEAAWRNAYGLRNLIDWGRTAGLVSARHALVYSLIFQMRALLGGGQTRFRRMAIYRLMARHGWQGRILNIPPSMWVGLRDCDDVEAQFAASAISYGHGDGIRRISSAT